MSVELVLARLNPWWSDPGDLPREGSQAPRKKLADIWSAVVAGACSKPGRAQVLMGARRVGKTTLMLQIIARALAGGNLTRGEASGPTWPARQIVYVDFSHDHFVRRPSIREALEASASRAGPNWPRLLVFDEVTQANDWARGLKTLVDESNRGTTWDVVLATDSSASLLSAGAADLLVGRKEDHLLTGLLWPEYKSLTGHQQLALDPFESYLRLGGFPEHRFEVDPARARALIRSDVSNRSIARDLSREGIDVERARALFVCLARLSGAVFSPTERAGDLAVPGDARSRPDHRTVQDWGRALERAFLLVPVHQRASSKAGGRAKPLARPRFKYYAADHGLISAYAVESDPLASSEIRGRVFEAVVLTHLRVFAERRGIPITFLHGKDPGSNRDSAELDFMLDLGSRRVVVEVTASADGRSKLHQANERLAREHKASTLIVVHAGESQPVKKDVRLVRLEEFLEDVAGNLEAGA